MGEEASCPAFAATDEIERTRYLQFLWCMSDKDPLREAVLPLKAVKYDSLPAATRTSITPLHFPRNFAKIGKKQAAQIATQRKEWLTNLWFKQGRPLYEPVWALGIEYEQTWTRLSQHRGRLLGSAPLGLYPATRQMTLRTWEKRFSKRTLNEALEEARTLEIGANDRWSLASKKQFVVQSNSTFNPSATLNSVTIPAGQVPVTLGGNLGVSNTISSGSTNTLERGSEFITENTMKALESIKTTRSTTVEESVESGIERSSSETLANPNRCNTLTYCYYEIIEKWEIISRPARVDLFLFVPLEYQTAITLEWLLANECALRPLIPCDVLARGFDAARKLHAADLLRAMQVEDLENQADAEDAGAPEDAALKGVVKAVDSLLTVYRELSGAQQSEQGVGSWLYWELIKLISVTIADALALLEERWQNVDKTSRADVADAVEDFRGRLGDVEAEFLKVNAAIVICTAVAAGTFSGVAPPLSHIVIAAVVAILTALELAGLDLIPDDRGLKSKIKKVFTKLDGSLAPAIQADPASALASGPQSDYALSQQVAERLRNEQRMQETAEAEVAVEALRTHISERIFFYHQVLWSQYDPNRIKQRLLALGLPPGLFELRFYSFDLDRGALRVLDLALAQKLGFDPKGMAEWQKNCKDEAVTKRIEVMLPSPAVVVEPLLGQCNGADDFVMAHRELDLERAEAELRQAHAQADHDEAEAARLTSLITAGLLDDPTPYGHADKLVLHVAAEAAPAAASASTTTAVDDGDT